MKHRSCISIIAVAFLTISNASWVSLALAADHSAVQSAQETKSNVAGLPYCGPSDKRIIVPTWSATLDARENLSSRPPQNDGQVVYIELNADNELAGCAGADADHLFSFSSPENPNEPLQGGLAVNLRGNVQFANGICYFKGFYMNKEVMGMHQGWIETYFGAVDPFEVIKSDRYCAAR